MPHKADPTIPGDNDEDYEGLFGIVPHHGEFFRVVTQEGDVRLFTRDQIDPGGYGVTIESFRPLTHPESFSEVQGWAARPHGQSHYHDVRPTRLEAAAVAYQERQAEIERRDTPEHRAAFEQLLAEAPEPAARDRSFKSSYGRSL